MNALFDYKPFFDFASAQARSMMVKRGDSIGVSWQGRIDSLQQHDWSRELANVQDTQLQLPAYYQVPFHAYADGNLSWQVCAPPYTEVEGGCRTGVGEVLSECTSSCNQQIVCGGRRRGRWTVRQRRCTRPSSTRKERSWTAR